MENVGLNNAVVVGGKKFHIQTHYLEPNEKIVSTLFEDGKVVLSKMKEVKSDTSSSEIKKQLNLLHQEMIDDLEIIFYIAEKVHSIRHPVSNNKLGLIFLKKNLVDEAIAEFKKAIEIDSEYVEAYNNLGRAFLRQKLYQEALDTLLIGIGKNGSYADLYNNLGEAYYRLEKYPEAARELTRALEINNNYNTASINLSFVYLKTIYYDIQDSKLPPMSERIEKVKLLLMNVNGKGTHYNYQYLATAVDCLEKNNIEEAIQSLEKADSERTDSFDENLVNEFYLKFMFGGKGKDNDFIRDYSNKLKEIVANHPEYADLRNNLGIAYLIQCRNLFLSALDEFRHALKINPDFKKAEKNLKLAENDGKGFLILLRAILK